MLDSFEESQDNGGIGVLILKIFTDRLRTPLTGAIFGGCELELLLLWLFCSDKLRRVRHSCCAALTSLSLN